LTPSEEGEEAEVEAEEEEEEDDLGTLPPRPAGRRCIAATEGGPVSPTRGGRRAPAGVEVVVVSESEIEGKCAEEGLEDD